MIIIPKKDRSTWHNGYVVVDATNTLTSNHICTRMCHETIFYFQHKYNHKGSLYNFMWWIVNNYCGCWDLQKWL